MSMYVQMPNRACVVQCEIIDHYTAPHLERYIERLVEARKKKNLTPEGARDLLHDANYFGTVRPSCHSMVPLNKRRSRHHVNCS